MAQQVDMLRGKAAAPLRGKRTVFCQCWKACQWLGTMPIVIWSLINSSPSTCSIRTCRRARHRSVKKFGVWPAHDPGRGSQGRSSASSSSRRPRRPRHCNLSVPRVDCSHFSGRWLPNGGYISHTQDFRRSSVGTNKIHDQTKVL